eukprot:SAG22_NODE_1750_length_3660_cov_2.073013_3_plen_121_part_00
MVDALRAGVTSYSDFDPVAPYGNGSQPLRIVPKPLEVPSLVPYGGAPPILMLVMAHCECRHGSSVLSHLTFCLLIPHTRCPAVPGNHPLNWKRQLFQDIIHGTKIFSKCSSSLSVIVFKA